MVVGGSLVAAGVGTTAGTLGLLGYLWQYRDRPGAGWFLATLACQAIWAGCYTTGLLVWHPLARWILEIVSMGALMGLAVFFPAFAVEYTGRADLGAPSSVAALVLVPVGTVVAAATNPLHHLFWTGYGIDPVWGLATVDYALEPVTLVIGTTAFLGPLLASLLLFDTVFSYGPLYRQEAAAVGTSSVPPFAGLVVWLYGIGPYPEVNFALVTFLPHIVLDAYAFLGSDMFEFHPATRRAGERAAIDDLGSPVVVVDEDERIVTLNPAAESVLGRPKRELLTDPLPDHLDGEGLTGEDRRVTVQVDGAPRTYAVTTTPLADASGDPVGYTLVWQDVTDDIRREQRLAVLNRVLRHNLRNDMSVVQGFVEAAADRVDDESVVELLDRAHGHGEALVALGNTAREVERVLASDPTPEPVDVGELLADVAAETRERFPEATVETDAGSVTATVDRETLRAVLLELLENAAIHAGEHPSIRVSVRDDGDAATVVVDDDGPGIPESELAVLDGGDETQLEHGSGLGLWLVTWGCRRLDVDLSFESDADGTTARLSLPREPEASTDRERDE